MKKSLLGAVCAFVITVITLPTQANLLGDTVNLQLDATLFIPAIPSSLDYAYSGSETVSPGVEFNDLMTEVPSAFGTYIPFTLDIFPGIQQLQLTMNNPGVLGDVSLESFALNLYDLHWLDGGVPIPGQIDSVFIAYNPNGLDAVPSWTSDSIGLTLVSPYAAAPGDHEITLGYTASHVPVPAAVWLFGSGLLGLIGIAKKKAVSRPSRN